MDAVALSIAWGSGTFRIPLLFLGLRRFGFVYLVWYAGRRAELMYVTTGITFWKLSSSSNNTHTHTRLTTIFPGLPRSAGTRKVKPIWILLKQETVSGSGISWAMCKSALRSRQITTPAPHHSVFYRPDALPATQPTASSH